MGDEYEITYPSLNYTEIINWLNNCSENCKIKTEEDLKNILSFLATFDGTLIYKVKDKIKKEDSLPFEKSSNKDSFFIVPTYSSGIMVDEFYHIREVDKQFIENNLILNLDKAFRDTIKE